MKGAAYPQKLLRPRNLPHVMRIDKLIDLEFQLGNILTLALHTYTKSQPTSHTPWLSTQFKTQSLIPNTNTIPTYQPHNTQVL